MFAAVLVLDDGRRFMNPLPQCTHALRLDPNHVARDPK
jgi:hypothetical protein